MTHDVSMSSFYEAVGRGISYWSLVEEELRQVLYHLIFTPGNLDILRELSDMKTAGIIFYSSSNIRWTTNLINSLMSHKNMTSDILSKWNTIENLLGRHYKKRNILAHGAVFGSNGMAYQIIMFDGLYKTRHRSLDHAQVLASANGFRKLTLRIRDLNSDIQRCLSGHN